ncbi:MAG: ABC transporter ATP-binding protein [Paenibacillaceae bacterium]
MNQPLSNLDAKLRDHMRFELKKLQKESGITTLYVTHDQIEALALSDKIGVIKHGVMVQRGIPSEIYEYPETQFVADFIGSTNFIKGEVTGPFELDGLYYATTAVGIMLVRSQTKLKGNEKIIISIRPENITLTLNKPSQDSNVYEAVVDTFIFLGESTGIQLKVNGTIIHTKIHPTAPVHEGGVVYLHFNPSKCIAIIEEDSIIPQKKVSS